jgi:uncharacterized protein DUF4919
MDKESDRFNGSVIIPEGVALFRLLRKAFANLPSYEGGWTGYPERDDIIVLRETDEDEFVSRSTDWLHRHPVDSDMHFQVADTFVRHNDPWRAVWHRFFYYGLLSSIIDSGDGMCEESAYKVIATSEIYAILLELFLTSGGTLKRQSYYKNRFDLMEIEIGGKTKQIYFDVSSSISAMKQSLAGRRDSTDDGEISKIASVSTLLGPFQKLRDSHMRSPHFAGLWSIEPARQSLVKSVEDGDIAVFLSRSIEWLRRCPVDAEVQLMRADSLKQIGDFSGHILHRFMYYGLAGCIFASGDGKTPETAYHLISADEAQTLRGELRGEVKEGIPGGHPTFLDLEIDGEQKRIFCDLPRCN